MNLCSVTTSEGIGNTKDGFHSVQQRLSGFHASQCGFCTPGMCMSIFSTLIKADKAADRPAPPPGFSRLTSSEAAEAISGNLCRCTGYRTIIDACRSFASDVDLEDLGLNSFWKKGAGRPDVSMLPAYVSGARICAFLKSDIVSCANQTSCGVPSAADTNNRWYYPKSIAELQRMFDSSWFDENLVKIVASNTSSGIYKDQDRLYDKYIDITGIPELSVTNRSSKGIDIGAALSISKAIDAFSDGNLVFRKVAHHLNKVATPFVRNTATIGGNIIMAQRLQFPSDIATLLLAVGSTVAIQVASKRLCLTLEDFLEQPPCDSRTLLLSIFVPDWGSYNVAFETYRAAPCPLGNSASYANSAFLARISEVAAPGEVFIEDIRLAFGAYGTKHTIRARKVESLLNGKSMSASIVLEAIRLLKEIITPTVGTTHPEYRVSLAVSFLFGFLSSICNNLNGPSTVIAPTGSDGSEIINIPTDCSPEKHINVHNDDLPIRSRQELVFTDDHRPVGEAVKKAGADLQASGEAVYVDDIPVPNGCLHGAFIYSTNPHARIKGIKFRKSLDSNKVITVIDAKDIPTGGENIGSTFGTLGDEALFADSVSQFAGQNIGVVIATSPRYAYMAAKQAYVEYSTEDLHPPILTIEDAVDQNSYFHPHPVLAPKPVGDFSRGMSEADHKILSAEVKLESQYYFYMETQVALAIPDKDNCITVYSSTQMPEATQNVIARCLGVPFHNVRVLTRRVGGGFGGKAMKAMHVACACAVASFKLRCPIRMYLDRKTDMIMAGGRHPMKVKYSVGFKSCDTITALHLDVAINAGISPDYSPLMPIAIIGAVKKYNWGALTFDMKVCKTNTSSKSTMRAPGGVQGSFIAECVIEHVASVLSAEGNTIRRKNLHDFESLKVFFGDAAGMDPTCYTLVTVFDKLALSPSYASRAAMVERFNGRNRWKKRGISCVPITYMVILRPTPGRVSILNDGSIAVEVGGVEIGQGLWTKVKQGAWTAGSTTSETSCEAVRESCTALVQRLRPIRDSLEAKSGSSVSWSCLIAQATMASVNLSAQAYWTPDPSFTSYLNYGAAVSEVEVDILTGATTILRSDLVYDCGQSLNPAVDLGQVEGALVQGVGFFTSEEYVRNSDGLVISDGTSTYKIPMVDTIPKEFNVELVNGACSNQKRVLSSKAAGEAPLLLASSVHCAAREAIRAARTQFSVCTGPASTQLTFRMDAPATMVAVKQLCGLDVVEKHLESLCVTQHKNLDY